MSKYKSLFLSDTTEHLDALEGDLVQLDQNPGDKERIHEVFRHMHSIKGMASSMGYEEMAMLAHRLEDLMAPHREKEIALSGEEVDILLQGLDEFRSQLAAVEKEHPLDAVPVNLLEGIKKLVANVKPAPKMETSTQIQASSSLSPGAASGDYWVEATVAKESSTPSVRAFLVYKRLSEIGQVVNAVPGVDDLRAGRFDGRSVKFRLRTDRGAAEIKRLATSFVDIVAFDVRREDEQEPAPKESPESTGTKPHARLRTSTVRVHTELLDFFVDSVGELVTLRSHFEDLSERLDAPAMREGVRRLGKVVRRLHDRVMEIRMVPVSLLTQRLPRVCRDIARSRGKQVQFTVEGENVELDRALVEALDTPVLHLLRNAVDHGVESAEERVAVGKPPDGRIDLRVSRSPDRVVLVLSDDGRGIDPARIIARAQELGLQETEFGARTESEIMDLIFRPGFSTRAGVTEVSGRGVGLDAVRTELGRLGGRVVVKSERGKGTSFVLDLPLTLAILQVLLVDTGGVQLALPAQRVMRVLTLGEDRILHRERGLSLEYGDREYPLVDLMDLLESKAGLDAHKDFPGKMREAVLVGEEGNPRMALGVTRVTGHQEVVLKGVGSFLKRLGPFGGSTVLGDGRPLLLLDVDALLRRMPEMERREPEHG